ncbi:MAG: hypothetical protein SAL07_07200 [Oscillatoria sp. PMC 1051.18]|nr:hypothetical protein [Oscillatoria sp. PMC 1050.18]MEC5029683.1 hypothetical protein [Oscillatoria sp. PMC 1051.18]
MQPLTIGNIINVSINLYRQHFKLYLRLALFAFLWLLVPLYGWAKFFSNSALISRLTFNELIGNPETPKSARRYLKPRTWGFLLTNILILSALLFTLVISFILASIVIWIIFITPALRSSIEILLGETFVTNNVFLALLFIFVFIFFLLSLYFGATWWLYCRLFIATLPLAIEAKINPVTTIFRSFRLTKGYFFKFQGILIIASLVITPLELSLYFISLIVIGILSVFASNFNNYQVYYSMALEIFYLVILAINMIIFLPFIQSIKAVIYYNLLLRREGFGLDLARNNLFPETELSQGN